MKSRSKLAGLSALLFAAAFAVSSSLAANISYDQIIYESQPDLDASLLSGSVSMSFSSGTLEIWLQNTSANTGSGAVPLLTGMGFVLPSGMTIEGGNVWVAGGSDAVNFVGNDISAQYAYANSPIAFYNDGLSSGVLLVQNIVTTVNNGQATRFDGPPPQTIDGPGYGAMSENYTGLGGNTPAVNDTVYFSLDLNGWESWQNGELTDFIDDNNVVLAFGSPNSVPEGGMTLAMLGLAVVGIEGFRRRFAKP